MMTSEEAKQQSFDKWVKVEELVLDGKCLEAFYLAIDVKACGHCVENFGNCDVCSLQDKATGCHPTVMEAIDKLRILGNEKICGKTLDVDVILTIIADVQDLVLEK